MSDERVVDAVALAHIVRPYGAMVVASVLPHVTVVHHEGQAEMVDAAIVRAGLRGVRIDPRAVKVFPT